MAMVDAEFCELFRDDRDHAEFQLVTDTAHSLLKYIRDPQVTERIARANKKDVPSGTTQS